MNFMKSGLVAIIAFLLLQIPIIATNIPFFTYRVQATPGTVSTLVHNGYVDYFSYLAFIREAKEGAWRVPGLYTSEPTAPSFIYTFYIAVGKVAALTGLTPTVAYHVVRFVSVEVFAAALVLLLTELVPLPLVLPSLLVGVASTAPLVLLGRRIWDYSVPFWWYNLDPLFRFDYVPHHHAGTALTFLALYFFLRFLKNKRPGTLVAAIVGTFVSALIYPSPVLILILGIPLSVFWNTAIRLIRRRRFQPAPIIAAVCIVAAGMTAILILKRETLLGFPWSQWTAWDILHWNRYPNFERDFTAGGGLALLLAIPAMISMIFGTGGFTGRLLVVWAVLPYALLPFADTMGLAKIRMVFLENFIPLGILTVSTVNSLISLVRYPRIRTVLLALFTLVFLGISSETTRVFFQEKMGANRYNALHIRTPVAVMDAFRYLAGHAGRHEVVLAKGDVGIMLPAYAPLTSYFGHPVHTKDYDAKGYTVSKFYQGKLTRAEANALVTQGNIRYIFAGPQEVAEGGNILQYGLPLEAWYASGGVTVYKVNPKRP